jgi:uncharacterized RDD family membrane protein YckC
VEFNHKNKSIPEWRLQLQNAVQQRKGVQILSDEKQPLAAADTVRHRSAVATVTESPESIADPRVANAMRRITESRNTFMDPAPAPKRNPGIRPELSRPFGVVPTARGTADVVERPPVSTSPRPRLVNVTAPAPLKRDTNKLPRIEIGNPATEIEEENPTEASVIARPAEEIPESKRITITVETNTAEEPRWPVDEAEEIEDLAPISMRFGAGLFDFIIGSFASMLLLSPLVFAGAEWLSLGGLLILTATMAAVLFVYMTASLGFFGKTVGMKLFSLELVDAVENEYPSIRQSAANSAVFLLSLVFAGAGFLTIFFNEENRALHDLLSGTILVREF